MRYEVRIQRTVSKAAGKARLAGRNAFPTSSFLADLFGDFELELFFSLSFSLAWSGADEGGVWWSCFWVLGEIENRCPLYLV